MEMGFTAFHAGSNDGEVPANGTFDEATPSFTAESAQELPARRVAFSIREYPSSRYQANLYSVRWKDGKRSRERCGFRTREQAVAWGDALPGSAEERKVRRRADSKHVYAIQQGVDGPIKIGRATDISNRLWVIQSGNPQPVAVVGWCKGGSKLEKEFHEALKAYRIRGEWFRPAPAVIEAVEFIRESA